MVLFQNNIQPLKFEIKKQLVSRSERVKSVELHPDLPWVLVGLFSGNITIYDYQSQNVVKTIEVSQTPVRNAKFISRKQMLVTCSDDLQIRVFNYNTMEKIKTYEAHSDYIRYLVVHPTQQYLLSASDDSTIKLWDIDNNFNLIRTLDDHQNYVMMLSLNPRDPNTFASASQDRTIKVWTLQTTNTKANYTLTGHQSGLNCVDYFKGDKPYLISGADDRLIKIWDYQTKQCIHTLEGHQQNISTAIFHPELPLIISTAEDGAIRFWHSQTYKLETTLDYNMERVWSIDVSKDSSNLIAFGYDEGTVVVKIGSDEPIVSMNSGKVVYAKNMEFFTINLKAINASDAEVIKDGSILTVNQKELGMSDLYPTGMTHSPNGHLFGIYSDQEYSIYRSQTFKNAGFGQGTDLVWSASGDYAVREISSIKIFKGATNSLQYELKIDYVVEQLFGGVLLGARSADFIIFYHWDTAKVIRKIDVSPKKIIWNELNYLVAIITSQEIYFLKFQYDQLDSFLELEDQDEGYEQSFDVKEDLSEQVSSGTWIQSVFFYTTINGKVCYTMNGRVFVIDTNQKAFIIGYISTQNRLFLMDKYFKIISYEVNYQVTEFQSLISENQEDKALEILEQGIPEKYLEKLAQFLDTIDKKELAYKISRNPDHRFDLALQLGKVDEAYQLAKEYGQEIKLRQVGDVALKVGKLELAILALEAAQDYSGLFLIYSSLGLKEPLEKIAHAALKQTKMNIAFQCFFTLGDVYNCYKVLIQSKRYPEAALFAKTYCPSKISESVVLWKESLSKTYPVISQKIADPFDFPDQFGDLDLCLQIEKFYKQERASNDVPAHYYNQYQELLNYDVFQLIKETPDYELSQFTLQPENIDYENPLLNND